MNQSLCSFSYTGPTDSEIFVAGSGTIDFDEFVDIFARKVTMDPEAELKEVFRVFDSDHDGFISPAELYGVLSRLGEKITRVGHSTPIICSSYF